MNFINVKQGKILIVDDHIVNTKLLEKILKKDGFEHFISVNDSREVISTYKTYQPDVILLDLKMPHLDGFDIMEQLAEFEDYLPVIVITAQNDQTNMKRAFDLGARDFIGKPFNYDEVLLRIRNMLEVRLLHSEVVKQNNTLEEKVKERTKELEDLQKELINRLSLIMEYRDNETGYHVIRMSLYTKALALECGFSEEEAELLRQASAMHDLGKVSVSDTILLKPGSLTTDEFQEMKMHTVRGAEMLSGSHFKFIQLAEDIARSHHEKWDGTGYPNGLKGEEIPLAARIVAICDVFDALTSERPYKHAWSMREAVEEITRNAGTHFDRNIVNNFIKILPKIEEIMEEFKILEELGKEQIQQ